MLVRICFIIMCVISFSALSAEKTLEGKSEAKPAEDHVVRGRTLRQWVKQLESPNQDEVIEAIQALIIAKGKSGFALKALEKLETSADTEVATSAKEAAKQLREAKKQKDEAAK